MPTFCSIFFHWDSSNTTLFIGFRSTSQLKKICDNEQQCLLPIDPRKFALNRWACNGVEANMKLTYKCIPVPGIIFLPNDFCTFYHFCVNGLMVYFSMAFIFQWRVFNGIDFPMAFIFQWIGFPMLSFHWHYYRHFQWKAALKYAHLPSSMFHQYSVVANSSVQSSPSDYEGLRRKQCWLDTRISNIIFLSYFANIAANSISWGQSC